LPRKQRKTLEGYFLPHPAVELRYAVSW